MKSGNHTIEDSETRRKRLVYRSWHRGTREMDLIMGSFADRNAAAFSECDMDAYEEILSLSDPDLYNWITGQEEPPANIINPVFEKLRAHRPKLS
jgi:antitoxin CptB